MSAVGSSLVHRWGYIVLEMAEGKGTRTGQQQTQPTKRPPWWKRLWGWTEFGKKSGWNWLELLGALAVPVMVALVGIYFTVQQSRTQNEVEEQRAQAAALQEYFGQMSQLMLEEKLRGSPEDSEVRTLARARTMTVLEGLDPDRKGRLLQFLNEADLIKSGDPVLDLSGVDATEANLSRAYLGGADLSGANLSDANLSGAYLREADLSCAPPVDPRLTSSLTCTRLSGANLTDANLSSANLSCAEASVWWNEGKMDRTGCVNLSGANLSSAQLSDADLSGALLTDVQGIPTEELEAQPRDLEGATMPDGQQMPLGLPEKSRSSPSIELEAGEYTTDEFQPAFVLKVGQGWEVPSSETPEELPIDGPPGPGAHPNELRFISTKYVFDPSNPSERETVPAPRNVDEWASWFQSHPNLETSKPIQVNVGSASGVQIDLTEVTLTSKPGKYPKDCEQPCVSLFPSCNFPTCKYGFPYPLPGTSPSDEREIVSYVDLKSYPKWKDRFVIVDVGGKPVVINIKTTADTSDKFLPKAQEVLDSVEWEGR